MCLCLCAQLCLFCDPTDHTPGRSSVRGISQGRTLGMGCHFLLQGIFSTQGLNSWLLLARWSPVLQADSLSLSNQGNPCHICKVYFPFGKS